MEVAPPVRNIRLDGTLRFLRSTDVARSAAYDERTEFFVFRREEIACACRGACHLGGGEEFAQGRADFAVEIVAVLRVQLGFDALPSYEAVSMVGMASGLNRSWCRGPCGLR